MIEEYAKNIDLPSGRLEKISKGDLVVYVDYAQHLMHCNLLLKKLKETIMNHFGVFSDVEETEIKINVL